MSQAVVDFCDGLKTVLLDIEKRVGKAQATLASGAGQIENDARRQLEQAARQLQAFRIGAAGLAAQIRKDFPGQAAGAQKTLNEFGHEAQTAMRHMLVMMADAASTGADAAAHAFAAGARGAKKFAEEAREPAPKPRRARRKGSGWRKPAVRASEPKAKQTSATRRRKRS